jgi:hypothetical protein
MLTAEDNAIPNASMRLKGRETECHRPKPSSNSNLTVLLCGTDGSPQARHPWIEKALDRLRESTGKDRHIGRQVVLHLAIP